MFVESAQPQRAISGGIGRGKTPDPRVK